MLLLYACNGHKQDTTSTEPAVLKNGEQDRSLTLVRRQQDLAEVEWHGEQDEETNKNKTNGMEIEQTGE